HTRRSPDLRVDTKTPEHTHTHTHTHTHASLQENTVLFNASVFLFFTSQFTHVYLKLITDLSLSLSHTHSHSHTHTHTHTHSFSCSQSLGVRACVNYSQFFYSVFSPNNTN